MYLSFWCTAIQVKLTRPIGLEWRPQIQAPIQAQIEPLNKKQDILISFFYNVLFKLREQTIVSTWRRDFQPHSCLLHVLVRETHWAGNLRGAWDQHPAVDWHKTRGDFAVIQTLWGQIVLLVGPVQLGPRIPAFRFTAQIHQVFFCPHHWQERSVSCF